MSSDSSPAPSLTRLLSPEETCRILGGIPLVRLDRWRREGRLPWVQLTLKSIAYPEDGVQRFIEENLHPATREPTPTLAKPKSEEHRRRIAEGQRAAWARRKAAKS